MTEALTNSSEGHAGHQPMVDRQREYARLIRRGVELRGVVDGCRSTRESDWFVVPL